jgi:O-antigen/teichoic acid export membrane protein
LSDRRSAVEVESDTVSESRSEAMGRSTRLVLLSTVAARPIQLATSVFVARLLGPAGFGVLGLANSAAVTLSGICGLGFGDAAAKFIAQHFRRNRSKAEAFTSTIFWAASILGLVLMLAGWFLRRFWIAHLFPVGTPSAVVALCLTLAVANLLSSLCQNIFGGLQSFRDVAVFGVAQPILFLLLAIVLGRLLGVRGVLAASIGAATLLLIWSVRRIFQIDDALLAPRSVNPSVLKQVASFSLPIWIAAFVVNPITVFTFAFLGKQENGAFELGVLNVANALKMIVAILPGVITPVVTPAIIESVANESMDKYSRLLSDVSIAFGFLTLPVTIVCVFYSDVLFAVFGRQYTSSHQLFMPLAVSIAIGVFEAPLQFCLTAHGRTWLLLQLAIARAGIILGLALISVPTYKASGLAWSMLAAEFAVAILIGELCANWGVVSRKTVILFYAFVIALMAILAIASQCNSTIRWATGLPLSLAVAAGLIRVKPPIADWVVKAVPGFLRPAVERGIRSILRTA